MAFTMVEPGTAPKSMRSGNANLARQSEYDAYVKQATDAGKVGSITPEGSDTTRSIAHRVTHAGRRLNVNLAVWTAAGKVYFEKTDKAKAVRKPTAKKGDKASAKPAAEAAG